jgi:hypothetical protein
MTSGIGLDDEVEDGEEWEGVSLLGATVTRLRGEENVTVERWLSMGFDRQQVIEAYFICDWNLFVRVAVVVVLILSPSWLTLCCFKCVVCMCACTT